MKRKELGRLGEELALNYLKKHGYIILQQNFQCKKGEIDIICQKKKKLVFVEVKTKTTPNFGNMLEKINKKKIKSLVDTAYYYLLLNPNLPKSIRVDAIAVNIDVQNRKLKNLNHIKNITL